MEEHIADRADRHPGPGRALGRERDRATEGAVAVGLGVERGVLVAVAVVRRLAVVAGAITDATDQAEDRDEKAPHPGGEVQPPCPPERVCAVSARSGPLSPAPAPAG